MAMLLSGVIIGALGVRRPSWRPEGSACSRNSSAFAQPRLSALTLEDGRDGAARLSAAAENRTLTVHDWLRRGLVSGAAPTPPVTHPGPTGGGAM